VNINDVTSAWDDAGKGPRAQGAIHPTGSVSEEDYEASGAVQAGEVIDLIWTYVLPHMEGEPKIADFGCGDGRVLKYVAREFPESWGIDASASMLERLRDRVPGINVLESDGATGLEDFGADFIYSMAVFIHHDIYDGKTMLRGLSRGLKQGAFLAVQIPCYSAARERKSWTDVTVWTKEQLISTARAAGLKPVEVWESEGEFSYDAVGKNHNRLQIFRKGLSV